MSEPIESFGQLPLSPLRESSQGEKPCKLCFRADERPAETLPLLPLVSIGDWKYAPGT